MSGFMKTYLLAVLALLALCALASLLYAILGKRFTDKIVGTNLIGSLGVNMIVVFAVLASEDYVLDVALVFAMLSFLAVIVLCRFAGHHTMRRLRGEIAEDELKNTAEGDSRQ